MPANPRHAVPYGMADYWAIAQRRFWWIALPLFLCWLGIWAVSWLLPPVYQSEALILVEHQKVPETYVASNVSVELQDRLQSMTQQILSRTRLQTTIDRFHLYSSHKSVDKFTQSADPIDQMRKDIKIDLVRSPGRAELTAFKIQYSSSSPDVAQQVDRELTSLFIDENLRAQQQQSESTTGFLNSELADARTKLEEQEAKVRAFKTTHFGNLPTQMQTNVQILSGLQAQLQSTQRDLEGAKQQKLYLDSLLEQYNSQQAGLVPGDATAVEPETFDKKLMELRLRLADARSKYTEEYPDVMELKDSIAKTEKLKKQVEDEMSAKSGKKSDTFPMDVVQTTRKNASPSMMQIQSQLKMNDLEITQYQSKEKELESQISNYQARLNLTPQTEQGLADVSRGYEESMSNYNSLLQKQLQSQLATNLEYRQQGEQFSILDPPSLPTRPASPSHLKVSLGGLLLGIAFGVGFAALAEMTQQRIWKSGDLEGLVPAKILVAIPHLSTSTEERLQGIVRFAKVASATAMILVIVAGNLYALYRG